MNEPAESMASAEELAAKSWAELLDFSGTVAMVTGGAKGIGRAVASRLARSGAAVTIVDVDAGVSTAAQELFDQTGCAVASAIADVRDGETLLDIARTATRNGARRIVWANCAGVFPTHELPELTEEAWRHVVGINLDGTMNGSRAMATVADELGIGGVIVNISSVAGSRAGWPPGIAHYVASKHGVEGLTKALAVELGPRGIRVIALAPGTVLTDGLVDKFGPSGGDADPYLRMARRMPIRRPALPDDIARVVCLVASDAAAMMTGCTVAVDGGQMAT